MARKIELDLQINGTGEAIKDFEKLDNQIDKTGDSLDDLSNKKVKDLGTSFERMAGKFATAAKGISAAVNLAAGSLGLLGVESEKAQETLLKVQSALALTTGLKDFAEFMKESELATKAASVAQAAYAIVVGQSTGAMKLFRLALAATGIGALVVGIGLLIENWDKVVEVVNNAIDSFEELGTGTKTLISFMFPIIGVIRGIKFALEELGVVESKSAKKSREESEKRIESYRKEKEAFQENADTRLEGLDKEIKLLKAQGKDVDDLIIKRLQGEIDINKTLIQRLELENLLKSKFGILTKKEIEAVEDLKKKNEDLEIRLVEIQTNRDKKAEENRKKEKEERNKELLAQKEYNLNKLILDNESSDKILQARLELLETQRKIEVEAEGLKKSEIDLINSRYALKERELRRQNYKQAEEDTEDFTSTMKSLYIDGLSVPTQTLSTWDAFREKISILKDDIQDIYVSFGDAIGSIEGPLSSIGGVINGITNDFSVFQDAMVEFAGAEDGDSKVVAGLKATVAALDILGNALDSITQISAERTEERISQIERETDVKQRELQQQFNDGVITETQLANAQFEIENQRFQETEKQRKKEFERQKKFRIVSATIDMIQGAVSAFVSGFTSGIPAPGNAIVGAILAASVLAFGAVNIAKISKEKYQGGTPPSPPKITPPDTNLNLGNRDAAGENKQNTAVNTVSTQLFDVNTGAVGGAQNIEGMGNTGVERGMGPQRVYVVESDITSTQNRVNTIESDATIG